MARVSDAALAGALEGAQGDVATAAAALGLSRGHVYARVTRAGIDLAAIRARATKAQVAALCGERVTLSLEQYVLLRALADAVPQLRAEIDTQDRIIAALTAKIEAFGAQKGLIAA